MDLGNIGFGLLRLPLLLRKTAGLAVLTTAACAAAFGAADVQQDNGDEFRQLIKQSDKLVKKGSLAEAERLLLRAAEINKTDASVKLRLAFVYLKERKLNEAYETSFDVAKADPNNTYALAVLGASLLGYGKFPEAKQILEAAIRINRREALAWAGAGMLAFYENRINDSLQYLSQAVYHEPNDPDYLFAFAQVAARAEHYNEAAEAYTRFLGVSKSTDVDRRARIKGLISFLKFLGNKTNLYSASGEDQTLVNFDLASNRPVIKLKLNDRDEPMSFVLDTGSGISVISDVTAKRLGIDPITRGGYAKGIGGDGRFEIVYGFLREVEIGDVRIRNVPVYIRKFHNDGPRVDGYIGLSLISKFLTTIDYGSKTFKLERIKEDSRAAVAAAEDVSLPLRLTSSGFLSGEVKLEGVEQPLNFIVDTGATVSVISPEVANLGPISSCEQNERMRVIGSAGITEDVPSFLLPRVSFGSHSRKSITAIALDLDMINEASGFQQAGILGGNFLRNYRMTFDFKNSKVTFVPVEKEP